MQNRLPALSVVSEGNGVLFLLIEVPHCPFTKGPPTFPRPRFESPFLQLKWCYLPWSDNYHAPYTPLPHSQVARNPRKVTRLLHVPGSSARAHWSPVGDPDLKTHTHTLCPQMDRANAARARREKILAKGSTRLGLITGNQVKSDCAGMLFHVDMETKLAALQNISISAQD